jgi:hypothetical protein
LLTGFQLNGAIGDNDRKNAHPREGEPVAKFVRKYLIDQIHHDETDGKPE